MSSALRFSEDTLLKLGTVLVGLTLLFTVAVLGFCDRQDERLASAGINIEELAGRCADGR